jgi:hypothetical protein
MFNRSAPPAICRLEVAVEAMKQPFGKDIMGFGSGTVGVGIDHTRPHR